MFVFESTLNRRVDERYNGIIYIRINSKLVISEWGSIDRESNGEGRRKKEKRIVLPKTVRQKCNACSSKPRFLERSFALSPNLCTFERNSQAVHHLSPSIHPKKSPPKSSSLTSFYNEMSSLGTTFPRLYLEPIRLTSSQSGEIRKRKGGKKEEAVKRITGMINSRVAVAEARSEERAWRTTRVLIITIIRGQLRR